MSDLIDRQKAINAIENTECELSSEAWDELTDAIMSVPSAQPELDEWCTDCKEYDQKRHCCPRFRRVIRETVEDVRLRRR